MGIEGAAIRNRKLKQGKNCKYTPHPVMRLPGLTRGRNAFGRWKRLRPANGERATMKTKAKASEPRREGTKSEIQRDGRGKEG